MSASQQNALVQKYCGVCHTDVSKNGGLTLQHFDAAHPDPGVAAMMLGKLRTGAIGAAGIKIPDDATVQAWISATRAEAAGAQRWNVERDDALIAASIVQELPSPVTLPNGDKVPDSYRLAVTCRPASHQAEMVLSWSPAEPKPGQVFTALVDDHAAASYKVEGKEKMGNGQAGESGPGSIKLDAMTLPARTLTIRDAFPNETVAFPFSELAPADRNALATCFAGDSAQVNLQ
jgi:hypothetical protein